MTYGKENSLELSEEVARKKIADYLWEVHGIPPSAGHEYKERFIKLVQNELIDLKESRPKPNDIFERPDKPELSKTLDDSFGKRSTEESVDDTVEQTD